MNVTNHVPSKSMQNSLKLPLRMTRRISQSPERKAARRAQSWSPMRLPAAHEVFSRRKQSFRPYRRRPFARAGIGWEPKMMFALEIYVAMAFGAAIGFFIGALFHAGHQIEGD